MKLVVDVPARLAERMKEATAGGSYDGLQDFVRTAVANQVEMEQGTISGGGGASVSEISLGEPSAQEGDSDSGADSPSRALERNDFGDVSSVPTPDRRRTPDGPLWGQYNRILPIKLVVRRLANVVGGETPGPATDQDGYVNRDPFGRDTAAVAREVGEELVALDEKQDRGRGTRLATAFPTGDDARKSMDRFESHFVGRADREENLRGAPPSLLLVDITPDDPSRIGLTSHGLEFARLPNPIFDDQDGSVALSDEERAWYVDHVRERLPEEFDAMRETLQGIEDGDDRPDDLTARISTLDPDWSEAQANTVRSGLLGRLGELGMVERERVGQRRIRYGLTNRGRQFLTEED